MSYNYIGQLHHNLNKYDVVVGLEIPDVRTIPYYKPFSTDPQYCKKWDTVFNQVLYETCTKVWPAYLATITKLDHSKETFKHTMEKEIPAVIPDFKLKPIEPEPTSITAYPRAKRVKRFITDLISLGIQGFTAFYENRKQNQLKRGMKQLFERQDKLENKVVELEKDMIPLAYVATEGLEHLQNELVRQGKHIRNLTGRVRKIELTLEYMDYNVTDNRNSIKFLGSMFGILLSDLNR